MNFMVNGIIQFEENVECDSLFMRRSIAHVFDAGSTDTLAIEAYTNCLEMGPTQQGADSPYIKRAVERLEELKHKLERD
jgi:hypothetical protein